MSDNFDLYFRDLKPDVQAQFLRVLGITNPEEANLDVFPVASVPLGDVEARMESAYPNSDELISQYMKCINEEIIPSTDFEMLADSYRTPDKKYAKEFLQDLHMAFRFTYKTNTVTPELCGDEVLLPAVIKAKDSGDICIGLVQLDLTSSGEHGNTVFFSENGIVKSGDYSADLFYMHFIPYDYWYTMRVPGDHHVDFLHIPRDVFDMVYDIEPLEPEARLKKAKRPKQQER